VRIEILTAATADTSVSFEVTTAVNVDIFVRIDILRAVTAGTSVGFEVLTDVTG
jgi:hypothetical protein